jgi:superfamily II DNA or RNA helicase
MKMKMRRKKMELTKEQKQDLIQKAARKAWEAAGSWGLLAMCTGSGKSKVAVDIVRDLWKDQFLKEFVSDSNAIYDTTFREPLNIVLVVPTEKLRDNNWEEEFKKWGADNEYKILIRTCYASLNKYNSKGEKIIYDLVILDEAHTLTELSSKFFSSSSVKRLLALSATPPDAKAKEGTDVKKVALFKQFRIKTDFYYPLDQARKDGLVADYELWVVRTQLDNVDKYIEAGPKAKRFYQTELERYKFLTKMIQKFAMMKNFIMLKVKSLERMRLIANSIEKLDVCKRLLEKCAGNRILVFGGSIDQIEKLMPGQVYHSKSGKVGHAYLAQFMAEEVDVCGTVAAANEGLNIPNLDIGLIAQISSDSRSLVQRIGRCIRARPDPNHKSIVFIVIAKGTQDEKWLEAAFEGMDKSIINYIDAKNI